MTDTAPAVRMPTDEMILAGAKAAQSAEAHHVSWKDAALSVWSAMEAAATVAPAGEGLDRESLIALIMEETTDDLIGDGWEKLGKPNVLVQGCRFLRKANRADPTDGYENPDAAARKFAGFIADRILAARRARSEPEAGAVAKGLDWQKPTSADQHEGFAECDLIAPGIGGYYGIQKDGAGCILWRVEDPFAFDAFPTVEAAKAHAEAHWQEAISRKITSAHPAPSDPSATERMRAAAKDALAWMARAHDRIHCLPRNTDTALAGGIDASISRLRQALAALGEAQQ